MIRRVVMIAEDKCTGCGDCIPNCPEGALQIIDGKARLVSDLMCDGLGACLGPCPAGAISIEEREAEPYDERIAMVNVTRQGPNTVRAHLRHLLEHGLVEYHAEAVAYLREHGLPVPELRSPMVQVVAGSGARTQQVSLDRGATAPVRPSSSTLTHWPVKMHLISPAAVHYHGSDLLLVADCVAYALPDFHEDYLRGHTLAVGCPKLDVHQEIYLDKLASLFDHAELNSLTVIIMQVPCCRGLLQLARAAAAQARQHPPIQCIEVGVDGTILQEVQVA